MKVCGISRVFLCTKTYFGPLFLCEPFYGNGNGNFHFSVPNIYRNIALYTCFGCYNLFLCSNKIIC